MNSQPCLLKAHDIGFGDHIRKLDRIHEGGVQRLELGLRHPTGNAARSSNEDRNLGLKHLRDQFRKWQKAHAVNVLCNPFLHKSHRFANECDRAWLVGAHRTDGRDQGKRRLRWVVARVQRNR